MLDWILNFWCRHTHGLPMRPINGVYRCRRCLRTFPTQWEASPTPPRAQTRTGYVEAR